MSKTIDQGPTCIGLSFFFLPKLKNIFQWSPIYSTCLKFEVAFYSVMRLKMVNCFLLWDLEMQPYVLFKKVLWVAFKDLVVLFTKKSAALLMET